MPNDFDTLEFGFPLELKFMQDSATPGAFEGHAATFNGTDHGGDTIMPGAFAESIAAHKAAGSAPALLWHHRGAEPVGRITSMAEDAHGLAIGGQLNLATAAGRKAHEHAKAGDSTGLSIGYEVMPNGCQMKAQGRLLTKLHVHEVSMTPMPMDARARITGIKTLASRAELEALLVQSGLARRAALKIASAGWGALVNDGPIAADPALAVLGKRLDIALLQLKTLKG